MVENLRRKQKKKKIRAFSNKNMCERGLKCWNLEEKLKRNGGIIEVFFFPPSGKARDLSESLSLVSILSLAV